MNPESSPYSLCNVDAGPLNPALRSLLSREEVRSDYSAALKSLNGQSVFGCVVSLDGLLVNAVVI